MDFERPQFGLRFAFALITVFCVASAISGLVSVVMMVVMLQVGGLVVCYVLDASRSRLNRNLGRLVFVLAMFISAALLWMIF